MHGNYFYLFDKGELAADAGSNEMAELAGAANERFNDRIRLDENNWNSPWLFVDTNGQVHCMDSEFASGVEDFKQKHKPETRFNELLQWSMQALAYDLHLYNASGIVIGAPDDADKRIEQASYFDLIDDIKRDIRERISDMYGVDFNPNSYMDSWRRQTTVERFELFLQSSVKPFTRETPTPYSYRAVDLRDGDNLTDAAIMVVDIHT